ncbi:MAG TPA: hypothetical protein VMW67_03895 [Desulfobacteria bacterium]|nr:hypothetical protein [Desulfobacteria bacterium]
MKLGLSVTIGLFIWMCLEIAVLLFSNKELILSSFDRTEGEDIKPESREYNLRALTLGGLTFAGIALLIDAYSADIQRAIDIIIILIYSFGLFLCSYKIEVLTNYKRLFWIMQEKFLNFGFLGLVASLAVFFYTERLTIVLAEFIVFSVIIVIIHLQEFKLDYKSYSERSVSQK